VLRRRRNPARNRLVRVFLVQLIAGSSHRSLKSDGVRNERF
jgi:hypothetical protein